MNTFWSQAGTVQRFPALEQDIKRDIVVIGGGIAGILASYLLTEQGRQVTLLEAGTLYCGTTRNTTAHITALQGYLYARLNQQSQENAQLYYQSQEQALNKYKQLIEKHNISCDFLSMDDYLYETGEPLSGLEQEYQALKDAGAPVELLSEGKLLGIPVKGAIKLPLQATFNPLKFLEALPREWEMFEHTRILKVDVKNKILYTEKNAIQANIIIVATGFPIINIPGWHFLRMYKSSSYNLAAETEVLPNHTAQAAAQDGLTFRMAHNNKVLIGGLGHRTGRTDGSDKYGRLEQVARTFFGDVHIADKWCANDCMTFDGVPLAGCYSRFSKDIYLLTGFNKWGMANSMICASLICDLIKGEDNLYKDLFSPARARGNIRGPISNTAEVAIDLMLKPLVPPLKGEDALAPGEGGIIFYKGRKAAAYKDSTGQLHLAQPLCSHLRCELVFNPVALTWDCPCHGSRFDIDGNIIVSPAVNPISVNNVN